MFKICKPYKEYQPSHITQGFHKNHTALDFGYKYGTFLVAPEDSIVYKVTKAETFDNSTEELSRGYGIRLKSNRHDSVYYLHWHTLPVFPVKVGDFVKQGQIVAQMGNSGFCIAGGKVVPIEGRTKKPYLGTHDHFEMLVDGIAVDARLYIDLTTPVKYGILDLITAIKVILAKIKNLIK